MYAQLTFPHAVRRKVHFPAWHGEMLLITFSISFESPRKVKKAFFPAWRGEKFPQARFPSRFIRFLGPGRHQESIEKTSAADLEENVSNQAFL